MQNEKWLVFDTETTGLLKPAGAALADQPKIIEIALIILSVRGPTFDIEPTGRVEHPEGCDVIGEHSWLINPGEQITDEITKITGITNADLVGKPAFAEVLTELIPHFLGATGLVAHNLPFDHGMMLNELRRVGKEYKFPWPPRQLCTVNEFLHVRGRRMKLTELYAHVMGKPLEQTHRALDDTKALADIVIKERVYA